MPAYRRRFEREGIALITRSASPADYYNRLNLTAAFQLSIAAATRRHQAAEALIVHAALLPPEAVPVFLFEEAREHFGEPLASQLAGDGIDAVIASLRSLSLVERTEVPDERHSAIVTDTIRLHRLVREIAGSLWQAEARLSARRALIAAVAAVYPADDLYVVTQWPRARRLDALGWALVGERVSLPPGSELAASDLMIRLAAFRNSSTPIGGQARTLLEHALEIRTEILGPEDLAVARCLNDLALLWWGYNDLVKARALCQQALQIRERALGPEHVLVAESLVNLARVRREDADLATAHDHCLRALSIYERARGSDHPDVALCASVLTTILIAAGDFPAAMPTATRALAIYEVSLGPDHPAIGAALVNLGKVHGGLGNPHAAEPLYRRALDIHERSLGPMHPTVAGSLFRLALLLEQLHDVEAATSYMKRALIIDEQVLEPEHRATVALRGHLARLAG